MPALVRVVRYTFTDTLTQMNDTDTGISSEIGIPSLASLKCQCRVPRSTVEELLTTSRVTRESQVLNAFTDSQPIEDKDTRELPHSRIVYFATLLFLCPTILSMRHSKTG